MRRQLKHAAEWLVLRSGAGAVRRRCRRGRILILAYHNVVPDESLHAGERSLHLPRSRFAAQLDSLLATHTVLPLEEALAAPPRGGRPVAVITFDDAYRGALTCALPELAARGLPATVFVAPGILGQGCWWDMLADAFHGSMPGALRERCIEELQGAAGLVAGSVAEVGAVTAPAPQHGRIATEDELAAAVGTARITLGAHSWSHRNLAALGEEQDIREELVRPLLWLREHFPRSVIPWIAYPYGRSDARVARLARACGYAGGLLISGGWLPRRGGDVFALPRLNVAAGLSSAGFQLRTSGFRA
jgi:peptidoglycan/xylan/chitin deacetylase (PgdA/CDA1 family)